MEASQERHLEAFPCKLTSWARPGLCVISLNTHILTADDTYLPQSLSKEKHKWSLHTILLPCWHLAALTSLRLKLFGFVSTEILHQSALSAKLSYHQIWGHPWWNPTFSATFLSDTWHKWKANTITSSLMLHTLTYMCWRTKLSVVHTALWKVKTLQKQHCALKWEGILNEKPNYEENN